jgi:hypothetical protein
MLRFSVAALIAACLIVAPASASCVYVYHTDTDPELVCQCEYRQAGPWGMQTIYSDGSELLRGGHRWVNDCNNDDYYDIEEIHGFYCPLGDGYGCIARQIGWYPLWPLP